ncbi:MAG TPA: hypothetical protein PLA18_07790 [Deltaproteobacteria bacterium]|jgi:hypothetical protein|nr:hypothetical protein [Deltaproteobacteria bacterium]
MKEIRGNPHAQAEYNISIIIYNIMYFVYFNAGEESRFQWTQRIMFFGATGAAAF